MYGVSRVVSSSIVICVFAVIASTGLSCHKKDVYQLPKGLSYDITIPIVSFLWLDPWEILNFSSVHFTLDQLNFDTSKAHVALIECNVWYPGQQQDTVELLLLMTAIDRNGNITYLPSDADCPILLTGTPYIENSTIVSAKTSNLPAFSLGLKFGVYIGFAKRDIKYLKSSDCGILHREIHSMLIGSVRVQIKEM